VKPDDIILAKQELDTSSWENRLRARVIRVIPLGLSRRVILDCGIRIVALIPNQSFRELNLQEGESVVVSFKAAAAHLIRIAFQNECKPE
jgi:molybdopterin-binding protein